MSGHNQSNDGNKKNPWGKNGASNGGGPRGAWGGGNEPPPDIDEMLKKAQENLKQVFPGGTGGGKIIGLGVVALIALWMASGFYIVNPGEHAVIQRFGAWDRTQMQEGLGYRWPAPIESMTKVRFSEIRRMNIGFSEIFSRDGGTQRRGIPEESLMLTSDRNIVDLNLVVQWNIKSSEDYLFQVFDQETTIKKVAESAIREVAGQTQMFSLITTERAAVADRAKEILQNNLDEYSSGVNITQVLIQQAEVHPDVQAAFQDVQAANQDAEDIQNRARAYREDILPRARGDAIRVLQEAEAYRQSTIARAEGDTNRFNAVYQAYLEGQDVTRTRMYLETMEEILRNAQKIIMDEAGQSGVVPYLPLNELRPAAGGQQNTAPAPVTTNTPANR